MSALGARLRRGAGLRRLGAFLRRDWKIAASYRVDFAFMAVGGVMTLTLFHFLGRLMGDVPALRGEGDYFSFALMGLAVAASLRSLQTSFANRLREAQTDGSLEVLLMAPLSTFQVIAGLAAYPILSALLRALALLAAGAWLFGAQLDVAPLPFAVALLASVATFGAVGLLSAAFVLVFKRGDPFSYALDVASYLLCGVLYPVTQLPPALQWVARFLPATHALRALRATGLHGAPLEAILPSLGVLALFGLVLWPLAALLLAAARRYTERAGTLGQS